MAAAPQPGLPPPLSWGVGKLGDGVRQGGPSPPREGKSEAGCLTAANGGRLAGAAAVRRPRSGAGRLCLGLVTWEVGRGGEALRSRGWRWQEGAGFQVRRRERGSSGSWLRPPARAQIRPPEVALPQASAPGWSLPLSAGRSLQEAEANPLRVASALQTRVDSLQPRVPSFIVLVLFQRNWVL